MMKLRFILRALGAVALAALPFGALAQDNTIKVGVIAAFEMTIGTFASLTTGATASAFGVRPKPARNWT